MTLSWDEMEPLVRDFETGEEITDVILLGKYGTIRRIILTDEEEIN